MNTDQFNKLINFCNELQFYLDALLKKIDKELILLTVDLWLCGNLSSWLFSEIKELTDTGSRPYIQLSDQHFSLRQVPVYEHSYNFGPYENNQHFQFS